MIVPQTNQAGADDQPLDMVLIGHIVKEMIHFPDRTLGPVLGSPVAYGSLMAGCLGTKVGIVTVMGTDMPTDLLQPLHSVGVNLEGVHVKLGDFTTCTDLIYDTNGNKEIRYPQKAPPIAFSNIPHHYQNARVLSIVAMDHDVPFEVIRQLRSSTSLLAIDLGGYGGAHSREHPSPEEQQNPHKLAELIACFDIVRASLEDCTLLFGANSVANDDGQDEIVKSFLRWGASIGLLNLGERGCVIAAANGVYRIPAQQGQVIDTTGAGDTFFAAFLADYIKMHDVERAARFAAAAVIYVVERTGGAHLGRMPTHEQVLTRLQT
jgi:sugar/nucleoside kinase (ribokinase family)